jgi:superfamily II DNA or RNA helicase
MIRQLGFFEVPAEEKKPTHSYVAPEWTSRTYQLDAVERFFRLIDKDEFKAPLLRMATGTGKTRTAGLGIIHRWLGERRGPVLWLSHLNTLIEQTRDNLCDMLGEFVGLEQGQRQWESERVCVASTASLYHGGRLKRIQGRPTLVVVDEAHHYVSDQNLRILKSFTRAHLCGLTATPKRHDGKALELGFDSIACQYPILSGMNDGYLVPIVARAAYIDGLDYSHITKRQLNADVVGEKIMAVMHSIIKRSMAEIGDRVTAAFWPTIKVAHLAAAIQNDMTPGIALSVDGTSMDPVVKRANIAAFVAGKCQIMHNVGVLTEGFDFPKIRCIWLCNPTDSSAVLEQEIGRGTRNVCEVDLYKTRDERKSAIAISKKPNLLVLDCVGNNGKHRFVDALDILSGEEVDEETLAEAREIIKKKAVTPDEAFKEARAAIDEEKKRKREEEAKRIRSAGEVNLKFKDVDLFANNKGKADSEIVNAVNRPSDRLVSSLKKYGISNPENMTTLEANRAKRMMDWRNANELCTMKQVNVMKQIGFGEQSFYFKKLAANKLTGAAIMEAKITHARSWVARPPSEVCRKILADHPPMEMGNQNGS